MKVISASVPCESTVKADCEPEYLEISNVQEQESLLSNEGCISSVATVINSDDIRSIFSVKISKSNIHAAVIDVILRKI